MSLRTMVYFLKRQWIFFASCALAFVVAGIAIYLVFNQYQADVEVYIAEDQTRILENLSDPLNLSNSFKTEEGKDGLKAVAVHLKSYQFFQDFLKQTCEPKNSALICSQLKGDISESALHMLKKVDFAIDDSQLLKISFKDRDPRVASETLNLLLDFLFKQTAGRQMDLVNKLSDELHFKKIELETRLKSRVREFSHMGNLSLSSVNAEKMFAYLGDTQIKATETEMKISENQKAIQILSRKMRGAANDDPMYGPASKIEALKAENELLKERYRRMQAQVKTGLKDQFLTGGKSESLTTLSQKFEVDKTAYESILKALARLDLLGVTQNKQFEVLQKAEPFLAKSTVPLLILLLAMIFLSQVFACMAVLVKALWQVETVNAPPYKQPWIVDHPVTGLGATSRNGLSPDQRFILHPHFGETTNSRGPNVTGTNTTFS